MVLEFFLNSNLCGTNLTESMSMYSAVSLVCITVGNDQPHTVVVTFKN